MFKEKIKMLLTILAIPICFMIYFGITNDITLVNETISNNPELLSKETPNVLFNMLIGFIFGMFVEGFIMISSLCGFIIFAKEITISKLGEK